MLQLTGIHHLTAISAHAKANLAFYTGTLGMRLVKKTVNQDDVSAYHLFYADGKASPGTDLTFFDWPAAREHRGTRAVSRTGLRVNGEKSIGFWRDRLIKLGVHTGNATEIDGRLTLPFEDPESQRLVLVDDGGIGTSNPWEKSPVPAEHQIRGPRSHRAQRARSGAHRTSAARGDEHAPGARLRISGQRASHPCL